MKPCIVIPTYWSTETNPSWKLFDHPTSLSEEGTLRRTLENLARCRLGIPVILFPAPTDDLIEQRVRALSAGLDLDLRVFSRSDLAQVHAAFSQAGFPGDLLADVNMDGYGAVRNMGLLWAALQGLDVVIQIDDDELIEDPDYLPKALEMLGGEIHGKKVWGKTGFYRDAQDRIVYDGQIAGFKNWPKDELFNAAVKKDYETPGRFASCIEAHGGNMVIHREMYRRVPYDPYGTRGEDDDYALNALYLGMQYFCDKSLWVRHLPPSRKGAFWTRHRQDIIRFKYLREKARLMKLTTEDLGIFLGHFTGENLEHLAVSSSIDAALRFVDKDRSEFQEFLNNAIVAEQLTRSELKTRAEKFLRFAKAWGECLPALIRCSG